MSCVCALGHHGFHLRILDMMVLLHYCIIRLMQFYSAFEFEVNTRAVKVTVSEAQCCGQKKEAKNRMFLLSMMGTVVDLVDLRVEKFGPTIWCSPQPMILASE